MPHRLAFPHFVSRSRLLLELRYRLAWSLHSFLSLRLARRNRRPLDQEFWSTELFGAFTSDLLGLLEQTLDQGRDPEASLVLAVETVKREAAPLVAYSIAAWSRWYGTAVPPGPVQRDYHAFWRFARSKMGESAVPDFATLLPDDNVTVRIAGAPVLVLGIIRDDYMEKIRYSLRQIEIHYRCVWLMRHSGVVSTTTAAWVRETATALKVLAKHLAHEGKGLGNRLNAFKQAVDRYERGRDRTPDTLTSSPTSEAVEKVEKVLRGNPLPRFSANFADRFREDLLAFAKTFYQNPTEQVAETAARDLVEGIG